ncbi:MAG: hypothetical protein JSV05_00310 [Candidatus Bathyarchaeota archaeon]|nr:MAG: hypothetical protein JSV05_00310 [Candidatus Bathyarchaeota archaeon]
MIPPELDLFAAIFGVFATIFIYSFLWKENPLSRAVEHLFIGLAAVFTLAFMYDAALTQGVWGTARLYEGNLIWAIPILISLMYFFFFSKKYFYLYRYPVSIVAGIMAGMMITGMIQSNFLVQIQSTAQLPLVGAGVWEGWPPPGLDSIIIIIGIITALSFFFFTWEHTGILGVSTKIGRYFLMATFGAAYGGTVMARMSLFIGRLRFLYETSYSDWFWAWYLVPIAVLCVVGVALWQRSKPQAED